MVLFFSFLKEPEHNELWGYEIFLFLSGKREELTMVELLFQNKNEGDYCQKTNSRKKT